MFAAGKSTLDRILIKVRDFVSLAVQNHLKDDSVNREPKRTLEKFQIDGVDNHEC